MYDLNGDWVGSISGTNNGDVFVEMKQKDNTISGKARIQDRMLGVSVYQFTGTIDGDEVFFNLIPEDRQKVLAANVMVAGRQVPVQMPAVVLGDVKVSATIKNSVISGRWESTVGTGGVFSITKTSAQKETPVSVDEREEKDQVFVMMPIAKEKPELEDILGAVKRATQKYGVGCLRVDEIEHTGKITDLILTEIQRSRYLVCDISMERPNVYYELGYAHGRGKEAILIAREGSTIHFDIKDYSIIFYKNITELEERLSRRIEAIRTKEKTKN